MLKPFSMTQAVNKSGTDSKPSNLTEEQEDDTKFNSNDKWQIFFKWAKVNTYLNSKIANTCFPATP